MDKQIYGQIDLWIIRFMDRQIYKIDRKIDKDSPFFSGRFASLRASAFITDHDPGLSKDPGSMQNPGSNFSQIKFFLKIFSGYPLND